MRFEDSSSGDSSEQNPQDTHYEQALATVIETRTASTTFLQRKLKIGYPRAASLMDELENQGVISAQEGAKPRRILIDSKNATSSSKPGSSYEEQELFE
jgi:S-DNA-T family DNA segregation ATPase FtsK/SpoIIIE